MKSIVDIDALAALIDARVAAALARDGATSGDDWIDQSISPLGRRLHCRLVRRGELPGKRVHRRVLVRRRDLDAYVLEHGVGPDVAADTKDDEAAAFASVGARRVG